MSLNSAITIYNAAVIAEIAPENLVGHWKFDDGSGTTVADASGNNFTGTFGAETMLDASAENPVWTADRFGTANKALLFDKGAKVTVPYSGAINPGEISISVWIRIDEQRNNRFMGLHSWHGYKNGHAAVLCVRGQPFPERLPEGHDEARRPNGRPGPALLAAPAAADGAGRGAGAVELVAPRARRA